MSPDRPVSSPIVAAGHAATAAAAAELLADGGNAFDAAIAAGFAAAVCEPALTSLGGGGFLLARTAAGEGTLFDFFSDTPGRALPKAELQPHFLPVTVRFPGSEQVFNTGLGSAAVPGVLRGYLHVHERLGRVPLARVLAPAIRLAREGVPLNAHQAYFLRLLEPIFRLRADGRALFTRGDALLGEGDVLHNAPLADFFETLPEDGERNFYEGALARRLARDMHEGQGLVTEVDLAAYRVIEREPLRVPYRDHVLWTNPPPSSGGALLGLSLERLAARREGDPVTLVAVMREVDARRSEWLAATHAPAFSRGTTHVSVCDAEGNAASMTTSNGEGSGYFVPGTGIQLNNMLGEDDLHPDGFHASPPGQRVTSMMSPSLLLRDGALRLVLGSGGSKRIRTALLQVVAGFVDEGRPLSELVERARLHWDGHTAQLEPGFDEAAVEALRAHVPVNVWSTRDVYFGGVNAVTPEGDAAADSRRGGVVTGVG